MKTVLFREELLRFINTLDAVEVAFGSIFLLTCGVAVFEIRELLSQRDRSRKSQQTRQFDQELASACRARCDFWLPARLTLSDFALRKLFKAVCQQAVHERVLEKHELLERYYYQSTKTASSPESWVFISLVQRQLYFQLVCESTLVEIDVAEFQKHASLISHLLEKMLLAAFEATQG